MLSLWQLKELSIEGLADVQKGVRRARAATREAVPKPMR